MQRPMRAGKNEADGPEKQAILFVRHTHTLHTGLGTRPQAKLGIIGLFFRLIVNKDRFDVGNYQSFLQGPFLVANYTCIIIPGSS